MGSAALAQAVDKLGRRPRTASPLERRKQPVRRATTQINAAPLRG
jgi:hypothetical protein